VRTAASSSTDALDDGGRRVPATLSMTKTRTAMLVPCGVAFLEPQRRSHARLAQHGFEMVAHARIGAKPVGHDRHQASTRGKVAQCRLEVPHSGQVVGAAASEREKGGFIRMMLGRSCRTMSDPIAAPSYPVIRASGNRAASRDRRVGSSSLSWSDR
jgi:hypothetical protein